MVALWRILKKNNEENGTTVYYGAAMKIVGFIMLISLGISMMEYRPFKYYDNMPAGWRQLFAPAVILLVYDIQYL